MGSEPEDVGAAISPAYEATLRGMVSALTAAKDAYARHDAAEALRGQADSAIPELLDTVDALRVSLAAEKSRAENEADRLRARLRETAQILIEEVGADGPMDAEDAARKAVGRMNRLRELADEGAHEAEPYARRVEEAQRARRALLRELVGQGHYQKVCPADGGGCGREECHGPDSCEALRHRQGGGTTPSRSGIPAHRVRGGIT